MSVHAKNKGTGLLLSTEKATLYAHIYSPPTVMSYKEKGKTGPILPKCINRYDRYVNSCQRHVGKPTLFFWHFFYRIVKSIAVEMRAVFWFSLPTQHQFQHLSWNGSRVLKMSDSIRTKTWNRWWMPVTFELLFGTAWIKLLCNNNQYSYMSSGDIQEKQVLWKHGVCWT